MQFVKKLFLIKNGTFLDIYSILNGSSIGSENLLIELAHKEIESLMKSKASNLNAKTCVVLELSRRICKNASF